MEEKNFIVLKQLNVLASRIIDKAVRENDNLEAVTSNRDLDMYTKTLNTITFNLLKNKLDK